METLEIMDAYMGAYKTVHGKFPIIRRRGSWFYIDHSHSAYRRSDLQEMTQNLRERAQTEKPAIDLRNLPDELINELSHGSKRRARRLKIDLPPKQTERTE